MSVKTLGNYVIKRGKWYHFQRRTPAQYKEHFPQNYIQCSLNTDSEVIAIQRAKEFGRFFNYYWTDIDKNGEDAELKRFKKAVKQLKMAGFEYRPYSEIITEIPQHELINRINTAYAVRNINTKAALIGTLKKPQLTIKRSLDILFKEEKFTLSKKTPNEVRKWKNPRIKAVNNFIKVCGDIPIEKISRADILYFKDWWVDRIMEDDLSANSANKDIGYIKRCVRVATDNFLLNVNVEELFTSVTLKDKNFRNERRPFPTAFIQDTLLQHIFKNTSHECKAFVFAMADTGCRIKELTGLDPDNDIILDADIPHIKIQPNAIRGIKTLTSRRDIPLVGSSLHAFRDLLHGKGFIDYLGREDALSAMLNKYMRANALIPSENISLYSLRHSFSDRMYEVDTPEKTHRAIFGHSHDREKYGDGITLEKKKFWLDKIAFKVRGLNVIYGMSGVCTKWALKSDKEIIKNVC